MNKLFFRRLRRHGGYAVLNIAGLTIGLAAAFLIFLYVRFERSYDDFQSKADRIYLLSCDQKTVNGVSQQGYTPAPMSTDAAAAFPDIEAVVRQDMQPMVVYHGSVVFEEGRFAYVDPTFFAVFDFPLLRGDPRTALSAPSSVVLTESTARKYFGDGNPMGQTLLIREEKIPVKVTGIMKDMPENTELKADALVSNSTCAFYDPQWDKRWTNFGLFAYVLLRPGVDAHVLEKKFPAFVQRREGEEEKKAQTWFTLHLLPLRSLYLFPGNPDVMPPAGNPTNVYIFSVVGIFILLIAGINFVNLTTARSTERAREVGIRKVAGAWRGQLILSFLAESVFLTLVAYLLAIAVCGSLVGPFNELAGKVVSTGPFEHPGDLLIFLGIALAIGVTAGIYPALALSAFRPVVVLRGRFTTGVHGLFLRRGLVVFQFMISIAFIVATGVIETQVSFLRSHPLGFDNKQLLSLPIAGIGHRQELKSAIARVPGVVSISLSSSMPGSDLLYTMSTLENKKGELESGTINLYLVDYDFIREHRIPFAAGRDYSPAFATESTKALVVNELTVKQLGYVNAQDAIGRRFNLFGREGRIIGVVKDFNYWSLKFKDAPIGLLLDPDDTKFLLARVSTTGLPATIAAIKRIWNQLLPGQPWSYAFEDEVFNRNYKNDDRFGRLFLVFSVLAIFISCLGLFGLASYATLQRTREIGIRKVLGASVAGIAALLSSEFLKLVVLALLIAGPLCWFFMNRWLADYAYHIAFPWWMLAAGGGMAIFVAVFTIGFQTIKAALANPATVLKTE